MKDSFSSFDTFAVGERQYGIARLSALEKAGFERVEHVPELERDQYAVDPDGWKALPSPPRATP